MDFEEVAGLLGLASSDSNPPEYLRDMLALRIKNEEVRQSDLKPKVSTETPAVAPVAKVESIEDRIKRKPSRGVLPWAIAALLLIGLTVSLILWRTERRSFELTIAQMGRTSEEIRAERAELDEELAKKNVELSEISTVLDSPRLRVLALKGQAGVAESSSGKIYWDEQANKWIVSAKLPPAPEGKVYQLWFVTPEEKISAGLIETDSSGKGFALVDGPGDASRLAAAAITLEPAGGSDQPTSPIYMLGQPGA